MNFCHYICQYICHGTEVKSQTQKAHLLVINYSLPSMKLIRRAARNYRLEKQVVQKDIYYVRA